MAEQPKPTITGKTLAQAAPKLPQMKNNPLTPEQVAAFSQLRNILDPTNQTFNPVSRLGALLMQQEGGQLAHWQTPLNVLGLTFSDKYLAEDASAAEIRMLKEAELSPISARDRVAVGPEALAGKRQDVIPHELAHYAFNKMGLEGYGIEEKLIRQLMINNGLNVKENMDFLGQTTPVDERNLLSIIQELTNKVTKDADKMLKARTKAKGK